ncbi:MFS family permease [Amycolatopsis bartoniae]|uniref:MFS transporter n=1 Tax=Amycolatopsis bartoniae TaxID=941986 RepID=A0A8H9ITP1_9PSEU|nr:MFS transporter [Amycolatopsis bartoniae]MBB2940149.1 MFS family permease [Amycolatopsis bartoniae]GHF36864.1 MFS transporter [Amycolatopsis bartoniae]
MSAQPARGSFRMVLSSLLVVELFSGVLQAYFVPLYPALAERFGVSTSSVSWALIIFTLSNAVFTPLFAKLGDVHGHHRVLRVLVGLVAAGCVLIAAAPDFGVLLAGRALQGMFPAYLPLMFGVLRGGFPGDATRRGIAYLSGILLFGTLAGVIASGLLVRATGGPALALWVPAIGTLLGFAVLLLVPARGFDRPADAGVDWPGVALLGLGLACLLLGLSQGSTWHWTSTRTLVLLAAGVAVLAGWVTVELRTGRPMVDLRFLFRGRLLPVYVVAIGVYSATIGTQVANSTFMALPSGRFGYGLGLNALHIGLALLPGIACAALAATLTARIGRILGYPWTMATGAILVCAGFLALVFLHTSLTEFILCTALSSAGMGFIEGSTRTIVIDNLHPEETSTGSGIYELSTTVGDSVGAAVITAVLTLNLTPRLGVVTEAGFRWVWAVAALFGLIAATAAIGFALRAGRRHYPAPAPTGASPLTVVHEDS